MPILGIIASQISGHLFTPSGAYDSLATVTVPSGGAASVSFAGIPSGYKHLQIRGIGRSDIASSGGDNIGVRFNSDTGTNYTYHILSGNGSAASAGGGGNTNQVYFADALIRNGSTASVFSGFVIDVLDYLDTNKYKTVRGLAGYDANGSGNIQLSSGVWRNTAAITSLTLVPNGNVIQYTSFALYGVK